jgi:hypothetical protein
VLFYSLFDSLHLLIGILFVYNYLVYLCVFCCGSNSLVGGLLYIHSFCLFYDTYVFGLFMTPQGSC